MAQEATGSGQSSMAAEYKTAPAKEKGWNLYRSLGSPQYLVAPMVAQSELAFRMLTRKYGAQLCYTPMLHSRLTVEQDSYKERNFSTCPEDRPLLVQLCGDNPQTLLAAAQKYEAECDAVDLNLGCPQGIARKGHYGSFLLEELDLLVDIVSLLHKNLKVPITCKIRILPTEEKTMELVKGLQAAGCAMLTVHGRTKEMKKDLVRECDWGIIKRIKDALEIPVFANGGIETFDDVKRCLAETGVDGVMSSESILSNPALFSGRTVPPIEMAREYLAFANKYPAYRKEKIAHIFKILHKQLSHFTELRNSMFAMDLESVPDKLAELEAKSDPAELAAAYAKLPDWYRRHTTYAGNLSQEEQTKKEKKKKLSKAEKRALKNQFKKETRAKREQEKQEEFAKRKRFRDDQQAQTEQKGDSDASAFAKDIGVESSNETKHRQKGAKPDDEPSDQKKAKTNQ